MDLKEITVCNTCLIKSMCTKCCKKFYDEVLITFPAIRPKTFKNICDSLKRGHLKISEKGFKIQYGPLAGLEIMDNGLINYKNDYL